MIRIVNLIIIIGLIHFTALVASYFFGDSYDQSLLYVLVGYVAARAVYNNDRE